MSEDLTRYHRQMILPGIGEDGQRRLLASTACVLGCGALGTVIADLLARHPEILAGRADGSPGEGDEASEDAAGASRA